MNVLLGAKAAWYLMRASGFVAFGLLTLTLALGVANVARWERGRWTRAVAALVHRNAALLATVFLAIHIVTAISDKYVSIPLLAAVIPGMSGYDPLWVGIGAVSLDVMVALVVTSLLRDRLGRRTWRVVHWVAYLAWPTALVHAIGAGSGSGVDTGHWWSTAIYISAGFVVAAAIVARLAVPARGPGRAPRHPGLGVARRPLPARLPEWPASGGPYAAVGPNAPDVAMVSAGRSLS
ncbi:MAG TPA: ferric reductase-like transmembrane domain-containing protein [Acidimicrobiales bacterium]|nr:ferric reductase-like transmembrane domain-containing protein [Acidimicrobiales bacterium]